MFDRVDGKSRIQMIQWIKNDYRTNRIRFIVEFIAWLLSISCSIIMAVTVPQPPLLLLYPLLLLLINLLLLLYLLLYLLQYLLLYLFLKQIKLFL